MAEVKIGNLDDWVLASHGTRAKAAGRSVEEELRHVLTEAALAVRPERRVLTEAALAARREWAEKLRKLHEEMLAENGGPLPDSTPGIREERDSWG